MNAENAAVSGRIRSGAEGSNLLDAEPQNTPESTRTPGANVADSHPTSLYWYYDKNELLLYVGITGRGMSRNSEHNKSKPWWEFVAHQKVEHFDSRHKALAAEKRAIQTYMPPFNVQHNPEHGAAEAAYRAFTELDVPLITPQVLKERGRDLRLVMAYDEPRGSSGLVDRYYRTSPGDGQLVRMFSLPRSETTPRKVPVAGGGHKSCGYIWMRGESVFAKVTRTRTDGPSVITAKILFANQKPVNLTINTLLVPEGSKVATKRGGSR